MNNSRKLIAGALLSALALGTFAMDAQAGQKFKGHKFHKFHHGYHYVYKPYFKGCWHFKKKYYHTGKKFWLRKYEECRYGDY